MLSRRTVLATAKLATACFEYNTFRGSRGVPTLHVRPDWFADLLFEKDFDLAMVNLARSLHPEGGSIKAFILQLYATACSSAVVESVANDVLVKLAASLLEYAYRPREQTRVPVDRATVDELVGCLEADGFMRGEGKLLRIEEGRSKMPVGAPAPRPQPQQSRPMPVAKDEALELLNRCLQGIGPVQLAGRDSVEFEKWWRGTDLAFARVFGDRSSPQSEFKYISFDPNAVTEIDDPESAARIRKEGLDSGLVRATGLIQTMIEQVELHWPTAARASGASPLAADRTAPVTRSRTPAPDVNAPAKVFVSYTHEDDTHKTWVRKLATDLRAGGIDVVLDQWDLRKGGDLTLFMERGVRESARVLLIFTPTYCVKANDRVGGVGYESLVITGELAGGLDTEKFVGVLRRGNWDTSVPSFLASRNHVDMTRDVEYEVRLEELLRDLHAAPANPKPPLGRNPFASSGGRGDP